MLAHSGWRMKSLDDDACKMERTKMDNDCGVGDDEPDVWISKLTSGKDENNNNFVSIPKLMMHQNPESANFDWIDANTLKTTASFLHCRQQLDEIVGWSGDKFCKQRKVSKVVTKVSKIEETTAKSTTMGKKNKKNECWSRSEFGPKNKKEAAHQKANQQEKSKRKKSRRKNENEKAGHALVKFKPEERAEGTTKRIASKSTKAIENGKNDDPNLNEIELTAEEQQNVIWKCFRKKGKKNGLRKNGNQNGYRWKIVECRMCDFTCRYAQKSASDTDKLMENHLSEKHNVDAIQIKANQKEAEDMKGKMKKMSLRSVVWDFFVIKDQNDEGRILSTMCTLCGFVGKHPGDSSTRVMRNHLNWVHKAELKSTRNK